MKSVCVYVGANIGNSLFNFANSFDVVYAFEPDPEIFQILSQRFHSYKNVKLFNVACSDEDKLADLYIMPNRVSTSLSDIDDEHFNLCKFKSSKKIKVKCINLYNFLVLHNIDKINYYISDCQGSDYDVLKTLKPMIDNKKIDKLFIETHGDIALYSNLNNKFSNFKNLLNQNYNFVYASLGSQNGRIVSEDQIPSGEFEWDSMWEVKK